MPRDSTPCSFPAPCTAWPMTCTRCSFQPRAPVPAARALVVAAEGDFPAEASAAAAAARSEESIPAGCANPGSALTAVGAARVRRQGCGTVLVRRRLFGVQFAAQHAHQHAVVLGSAEPFQLG